MDHILDKLFDRVLKKVMNDHRVNSNQELKVGQIVKY